MCTVIGNHILIYSSTFFCVYFIITAIHLHKGVGWNVSICLKHLIYYLLFVRLYKGFEKLQEIIKSHL